MDTSQIDLLALIGSDTVLKRAASTDGGEYAGECPFCGGRDRFRVWPHAEQPHFWCRQCNRQGDAIAYLRFHDPTLSFQDACAHLDLAVPSFKSNRFLPRRKPKIIPQAGAPGNLKNDYPALTDEDWQKAAVDFSRRGMDRLTSQTGSKDRKYLHGRGLDDRIIASAGLGLNPDDHHELWGKVEVWLPRGIVIPWWIDSRIWRINIRRPVADKEKRYIQPAGCANALYGVDAIYPGCTVLMVEGEFDALAAKAHLPLALKIIPVATGSSTGARLLRWVVAVGLAERVLLAFDDDKAGDEAATWWAGQLGAKATRLRPTQHDVTDMVKLGDDLRPWIDQALNS